MVFTPRERERKRKPMVYMYIVGPLSIPSESRDLSTVVVVVVVRERWKKMPPLKLVSPSSVNHINSIRLYISLTNMSCFRLAQFWMVLFRLLGIIKGQKMGFSSGKI